MRSQPKRSLHKVGYPITILIRVIIVIMTLMIMVLTLIILLIVTIIRRMVIIARAACFLFELDPHCGRNTISPAGRD